MKQPGSRRALLQAIRLLQQQKAHAEALLAAIALAHGGGYIVSSDQLAALTDDVQFALKRIGDGSIEVCARGARVPEPELVVTSVDGAPV